MTASGASEAANAEGVTPFTAYADIYDLFQAGKDYEGEVAFVDRLVRRHSSNPASSLRLLDLACGTGRHAIGFSELGYDVQASDISPAMVAVGRKRAAASGSAVVFHEESFATCGKLEGPFDVVVSMFASVNYLLTIEAFVGMLDNVRSLLAPGGIFIFDCWNGIAVVRDFQRNRIRRAPYGEHEIVRESKTTVDLMRQHAEVEFTFSQSVSQSVSPSVRLFSERHKLRYFYFQEMLDVLCLAGFDVLRSCPFMKEEEQPGPWDWNVSFVAQLRI